MNIRAQVGLLIVLAMAGNAYAGINWLHGKKHAKHENSAIVSVITGVPECKVDVDGDEAGVTDIEGRLTIKDADPGDHYVHVLCPGQREAAYFISPVAGETAEVDARAAATNSKAPEITSLNPAASEMELRNMVSEADQMRSSGRFNEAIELLHRASNLDPRNGDLHRELGITFLMIHDWERARVEMLEAVRLEPESVEAHSGLAYALEKLGDLDASLKEYHICTQMDPHDTSYRDHYVEVLGLLYAAKAQKKR